MSKEGQAATSGEIARKLRFDAREPGPLGTVKTMAVRLVQAADTINALEHRVRDLEAKSFTEDEVSRMIEVHRQRADAAEAALAKADLALQQVSLILGGTDEWTDQQTMIGNVINLAEAVKAELNAGAT